MTALINDINYQAFAYNKNILDKFTSICNPLFKINITTFAYFKFFNNERYLYLCNNLKWVEHCLLHVQDNETSLGRQIGHAKKDDFYCYLWPTIASDELLKALHGHDIWHGLSIFKKSDDYVELWGFATSRNNDFMSDFYMQNIELLKSFVMLFNQKAVSFTDHLDQSKLAIYKNIASDPYINFSDPYNFREIDKFILATDIKKYPIINPKGEEIFLSPREKQCLNHLSFGKTAKEISKELEISHRSVELYIQNARNKIGSKDKYETICLFKQSCQQWF